jgi:outer membrane protein assembly factor BamD (BamD/ComL family)
VSEKELEKTKKEVKELYETSKEELNKLNLKEKSDKFNKKLDDLYQETRFKKLENKSLDKFQLENIINDYKTNIYRL